MKEDGQIHTAPIVHCKAVIGYARQCLCWQSFAANPVNAPIMLLLHHLVTTFRGITETTHALMPSMLMRRCGGPISMRLSTFWQSGDTRTSAGTSYSATMIRCTVASPFSIRAE